MTSPTNASCENYFITTFYKFFPVEDPENLKMLFEKTAKELGIIGLVIMGREGINSTSACQNLQQLEQYKNFIRKITGDTDLHFKDSTSENSPFRRFRVKIRDEIVTLGTPELVPQSAQNHHLSPSQWNEVLKNEKDYVLIDTRNWYETKIGTFKGALNPKTDKFTEFPKFLEENNFSKEQKVLIFCTGGIRCEKGILELQRQGYENVYQLEGGILNYLEQFPNDQFEGECFVFDHRVAVDQNLHPSQSYHLCPHCGQPGTLEVTCKRCDTKTHVCEDCQQKDSRQDLCSKNCVHHWQLHPQQKGKHQSLTDRSHLLIPTT